MNKNIKKQLELIASWPEVKHIIAVLSKNGFQVVVAGGAVRDAFLNKIPKDIDLATSAKVEEVLKIFPYAKAEFAKYAVVFIPLKNKETLEITSFRKDSSYKDGRRPNSISYSSMKEDAKRRDFTINALFYDSQKEEIIDFVEGQKDLQNKVLRTVGKAEERFEEDQLRAIRALRFAHQLEFQMDEDIRKTIPAFSQKIKKISKERVLNELVKIFSVGRIGSAVKSLEEYNIFPSVFPTLDISLKRKYLKNPFDFWNREFSFCKEQAFFWAVFGLPFFYLDIKAFELFLKSLLVSSSHVKKSLSYLKAVQTLTTDQSSFTEKLQALNGQKKQVFELTSFWLKSRGLKIDPLNKILEEFENKEQEGKLPAPLVKGSDLLSFFPELPKQKFSSILKQAFVYQIEHPKASKSEILKKISTYTDLV